MLSILVWWAIPAVAVLVAVMLSSLRRRFHRYRTDTGSIRRYQRARRTLAQTQRAGRL